MQIIKEKSLKLKQEVVFMKNHTENKMATDYGTSRNNMATLRIEAKPAVVGLFGYMVFAYVDDREYILKSRKKVLEIPLFAGTHTVRLSPKKKSTSKLMQTAGKALEFVGAVGGSTDVYATGTLLRFTDALLSGTGGEISLEAGQTLTVKVKMKWTGGLVSYE